MKKMFVYTIWLIVSLAVLVVVRNIVSYELPQYSAIIMGVAFAVVVYTFLVIKERFNKPVTKHNQKANKPRS